jgi:DNA-binding transcriptional MerR regulator
MRRRQVPPLPNRKWAMPSRLPEKIYFKIGEVSEIVGVEPYVLRYWETEFDVLKPSKAPSKHRLYKKRDVELLLDIKRLLYAEGFTIEGARKKLKETKKEEKDQLRLPLSEQKYKSALVKLKKDLESLRRLLS